MGAKAKTRRRDVKKAKHTETIAEQSRLVEAALCVGAIGTPAQQKWAQDRHALRDRIALESDTVTLLATFGRLSLGEVAEKRATLKTEADRRLAEIGPYPEDATEAPAPDAGSATP